MGVMMKSSTGFHELMENLQDLTPHQRGQVAECLREIEHVQAINTLIENCVLSTPVYPKCGHDHIARWGKASRLQRYRRRIGGEQHPTINGDIAKINAALGATLLEALGLYPR